MSSVHLESLVHKRSNKGDSFILKLSGTSGPLELTFDDPKSVSLRYCPCNVTKTGINPILLLPKKTGSVLVTMNLVNNKGFVLNYKGKTSGTYTFANAFLIHVTGARQAVPPPPEPVPRVHVAPLPQPAPKALVIPDNSVLQKGLSCTMTVLPGPTLKLQFTLEPLILDVNDKVTLTFPRSVGLNFTGGPGSNGLTITDNPDSSKTMTLASNSTLRSGETVAATFTATGMAHNDSFSLTSRAIKQTQKYLIKRTAKITPTPRPAQPRTLIGLSAVLYIDCDPTVSEFAIKFTVKELTSTRTDGKVKLTFPAKVKLHSNRSGDLRNLALLEVGNSKTISLKPTSALRPGDTVWLFFDAEGATAGDLFELSSQGVSQIEKYKCGRMKVEPLHYFSMSSAGGARGQYLGLM